MSYETLVPELLKGSKAACSRLISLVENEGHGYAEVLKAVYHRAGDAYVIGITGPPGAGKSTVTDKLTGLLTDRGEKVGIIAIDPTSPFSKGAILGDRIRMGSVSANPNVFIRSMGSRGHLGGLSKATANALVIMSAYGCGYIFVETVGVGQSEVDIAGTADTTVMVLAPGLGDDIQAIKAGVMEIGDVFAVNKADKEGAGKTYRETLASLDFKTDWTFKPPVCLITAESGEGVDTLLINIFDHKKHLQESGELVIKRGRKKAVHVRDIVRDRLNRRVEELIEAVDISSGAVDPYTLSEEIFKDLGVSPQYVACDMKTPLLF